MKSISTRQISSLLLKIVLISQVFVNYLILNESIAQQQSLKYKGPELQLTKKCHLSCSRYQFSEGRTHLLSVVCIKKGRSSFHKMQAFYFETLGEMVSFFSPHPSKVIKTLIQQKSLFEWKSQEIIESKSKVFNLSFYLPKAQL